MNMSRTITSLPDFHLRGMGYHARLLLLLVLWVYAGSSNASSAYGRWFVLETANSDRASVQLGAAPPGAGVASHPGSEVEGDELIAASGEAEVSDAASLSQLEQQLDDARVQGGPYSQALAEPLGDLARYYRRQGDFAAALSLYGQALHNLRVNEGLYSEGQVPLVREMLSLYRDAGEYESLDDRYDYFFRLYGSGQPPYDDLRLRAVTEYLRWQREAYLRGLRSSDRDLLTLFERNSRLLRRNDDAPPLPPEWEQALVLSQIQNLYVLAQAVEPLVVSGNSSNVFSNSRRLPGAGPDEQQQDFTRTRLENIDRTVLARGRRLMEDLLAKTPPDRVKQRALLLRELGDWYQWHESSARAMDYYQQSIALLQGAQRSDLVEQWWGQPVELPDSNVFVVPGQSSGDSLQVGMTVSASGRVTVDSLAFNGAPTDNIGSRLRRELDSTRFRPAFVNGEPVAARIARRDYRVQQR